MRVAHVIPYMNMRAGGPVVVVDRICRQLALRGVETVVLTTDAFADAGECAARPSAHAIGPGGDYELRRCRSVWRRYAYSPLLAGELERIVPTCDLVHIHT